MKPSHFVVFLILSINTLPKAVSSQTYSWFEMNAIRSQENLQAEIIQDWHSVEGDIPTRQKYMTIRVGEFWPGQDYRVPVRLVVPATSKAKGFRLTGEHTLKPIFYSEVLKTL